jgi:hypothetical protein
MPASRERYRSENPFRDGSVGVPLRRFGRFLGLGPDREHGDAVRSSNVSDGEIPVYVKFRDDLGNASNAVTHAPIKKDTTPSTGSVSASARHRFPAST